jgi:hypothetical protein
LELRLVRLEVEIRLVLVIRAIPVVVSGLALRAALLLRGLGFGFALAPRRSGSGFGVGLRLSIFLSVIHDDNLRRLQSVRLYRLRIRANPTRHTSLSLAELRNDAHEALGHTRGRTAAGRVRRARTGRACSSVVKEREERRLPAQSALAALGDTLDDGGELIVDL